MLIELPCNLLAALQALSLCMWQIGPMPTVMDPRIRDVEAMLELLVSGLTTCSFKGSAPVPLADVTPGDKAPPSCHRLRVARMRVRHTGSLLTL